MKLGLMVGVQDKGTQIFSAKGIQVYLKLFSTTGASEAFL